MSTVPFTLYRCDECHAEVLVSDQDVLKSKIDGWMTLTISVLGGSGHEKHFCKSCTPSKLKHHTARTEPAKDPR